MTEQAGRELDALVAEKVMGWTHIPVGSHPNLRSEAWTNDNGASAVFTLPFYSQDIAAAWEVVEQLKTLGWTCFLDNDDGQHDCEFARMGDQPFNAIQERGETAPLAICRAALNAVGYKGTP